MIHAKDHSLKAVLAAVTTNFLVTLVKFLGWSVSFSPSMLAEAVHSLADTLNQLLLLVGIRHGQGKPSKMYPWGKGQARYIWNLVSAMGIFFVGFGFTTYHGIHSLIFPRTPDTSSTVWVPISILLFSLVAESYSLMIAIRSVDKDRGEKNLIDFLTMGDNPTGLAVLLEDSIAVLGVILALIGLWLTKTTGSYIPDAITSIFIGCLMGFMAVALAIANGRILMGVSAGFDSELAIREFVDAYPTVERVVSLKTAVIGPGRLRVSIEVEFHGGILINRQQIERDADRIREGDDPAYILFETAERMVRTVGREINRLEADLHREFPEVAMIDLEVN